VRWCPDGDFGYFFASCISASRAQHVSDLHSKFAFMPHHVWKTGSMLDIQSPTAEIRRGKKKKDRKKKLQDENIMSASATQGGHKKEQRKLDGCRFEASTLKMSCKRTDLQV